MYKIIFISVRLTILLSAGPYVVSPYVWYVHYLVWVLGGGFRMARYKYHSSGDQDPFKTTMYSFMGVLGSWDQSLLGPRDLYDCSLLRSRIIRTMNLCDGVDLLV